MLVRFRTANSTYLVEALPGGKSAVRCESGTLADGVDHPVHVMVGLHVGSRFTAYDADNRLVMRTTAITSIDSVIL